MIVQHDYPFPPTKRSIPVVREDIREENIRLIFGLKIKLLRQSKGYSLSELADRADISVSYLNEIEKGKKYPKANKIATLAQALDTSYDWLVSLKLSKKLAPLAELLKSNLLNDLPLEVFGIEPRYLLELISDTPTKLNAFVSTLFEFARGYNITVEDFYFAVLRSYLEMHDNYFEDLEKAAGDFHAKYSFDGKVTYTDLYQYLTVHSRFHIDDKKFADFPELYPYRSVLHTEGHHKFLYLNNRLTPTQKTFILAREAGYHHLGIEPRSMIYSSSDVESFDQLLNNYRATYFASALLLPEKPLVEDLAAFFAAEAWDSEAFMQLVAKYDISAETFLLRLSSILPRHFDIEKIFFLRLTHKPNSPTYNLNKELHLTGLHNPHGTFLNEHYCRRWVSITIVQELEQQRMRGEYGQPLCRAQVSRYLDSENEYFCISIARPSFNDPSISTSSTLGILINDDFKKHVRFWNAANVRARQVNEACERCPLLDCQERAARPLELEKQRQKELLNQSLDRLTGIRKK